jgi:hypothetical protein
LNKRLIIFPLLGAILSACQTHRFEGTWSAPAYGQIIEIEQDRTRLFEITESSCLISESESELSLEDYESVFVVDPELQTLTDPGFNGVLDFHAPPVKYHKIEGLPKICESPIAQVGETGYQHDPVRDFQIFWETFNELYVSFNNRGVDWNAQYQSGINQLRQDISDAAFFEILVQQIKPLRDAHVEIIAEGIGEEDFTNRPTIVEVLINEYVKANNLSLPIEKEHVDAINEYIDNNLSLIEQIVDSYADSPEGIKSAANDKLKWFSTGGVSYLKIDAMLGFSNDHEDNALELETLDNALDEILYDIQDSAGLIIDVRLNPGGTDFLSMAIVSRFIDSRRHVFSKQARLGSSTTDMDEVILEPRGSLQYLGPIAVLTSASTQSAGEIFTLMMSSLPNVTIIGEPTQGALSDSLGKLLPNGFEFTLSNEFYYDVGGNWYEGAGIPVDTEVPVFTKEQRSNEKDLGLETAYSLLKTR